MQPARPGPGDPGLRLGPSSGPAARSKGAASGRRGVGTDPDHPALRLFGDSRIAGSGVARAIPLAPWRAAVWRRGRLDGRRLPRAAADGCAARRRTRLAEAPDRTMTKWLVASFCPVLV